MRKSQIKLEKVSQPADSLRKYHGSRKNAGEYEELNNYDELDLQLSIQQNFIDKSKQEIKARNKQKQVQLQQPLSEHDQARKQFIQELEYLTSENCPKKHPFDFEHSEILQIREIFKQFKNQELPLNRLCEEFISIMNLKLQVKWGTFSQSNVLKGEKLEALSKLGKMDRELMLNLVERLDRLNTSKIRWEEFLNFLDNEGVKREVINDAQLYGMGVKRIKQKKRVNLKETPNQIEYYIDCCIFMNVGKKSKFLLTIYEDNEAEIFDTQTFEVVQTIKFPSNYAQVEHYKIRINKSPNKAKYSTQAAQDKKTEMLDSTVNLQNKQKYSQTRQGIQLNQQLRLNSTQQRGGRRILTSKLESSNKNAKKSDSNYASVSNLKNLNDQIAIDYSQQQFLNQKQNKQRLLPQNQCKNNINQTAQSFQQLMSRKKLEAQYDYRQIKKKINKKTNNCDSGQKKFEVQYNEQHQGQFSYQTGQENQEDQGFGVKFLMPNLNEKSGEYKKLFEKKMNQVDKDIDRSFQKLQQIQKEKYGYSKIEHDNEEQRMRDKQMEYIASKNNLELRILKTQKIMKEQMQKNNKLQETNQYFYNLNSPSPLVVAQYQYLKLQLEKQGVDTMNQIEVSKHLIKRGIKVDANNLKLITGHSGQSNNSSIKQAGAGVNGIQQLDTYNQRNYCTPDMMAKYVQKLRQEEYDQKKDNQYLLVHGSKQENQISIQQQKPKEQQTKSVYTLCATFNEELQFLALSLVDREIKVYQCRQSGTKIKFEEYLSFHAKYIMTAICIERYVSNSRPILCMGSKAGEVQIYYIDEPVIDKSTDRPFEDGRVKEKQHDLSPINLFKNNTQQHQIIQANDQEKVKKPSGMSKNNPTLKKQQSYFSKGRDEFDETYESIQRKPEHVCTHICGDGTGSTCIKKQKEIEKAVVKKIQEKKDTQITQIKYVRDIGLICSTFNGNIKFLDAFVFKEVWSTSNDQRKDTQHTNIISIDISVKLGIMATGGAEGKLLLIDPYAFGIVDGVQAHFSEVLSTYIYEKQQQIITVAQDRTIGLWDSSRLEKIEVIRDIGELIHTPKFTSSSFDHQNGILYVGCQIISLWEAKVDQKVEVNALQVQILGKKILEERKMLDHQDPTFDPLKTKTVNIGAKTGNVLLTQSSTLVDFVVNQSLQDSDQFLITVDSENFLRIWNIQTSTTDLSFRLPTGSNGRVTAIAIDETNKFLAFGTNLGETKIINIKSGGVLYNLVNCSSEVTHLKFYKSQTEFWLFGACWNGKLMMWTKPTEENKFSTQGKCRLGHKSDIISIDCSQEFIASGGVDGKVVIWNIFSGQKKHTISMPAIKPQINIKLKTEYKDSSSELISQASREGSRESNYPEAHQNIKDISIGEKIKITVTELCFHPDNNNFVYALQESGDVHLIDCTNGVITQANIAKIKFNSGWACDKRNKRMFVVGDSGKACVYDISNGIAFEQKEQKETFEIQQQINQAFDQVPAKMSILNQTSDEQLQIITENGQDSQQQSIQQLDLYKAFSIDDVARTMSVSKVEQKNMQNNKNRSKLKKENTASMKWVPLTKWFTAHKIEKMEPNYVVSVKYHEIKKIYITGTFYGEVKIWQISRKSVDLQFEMVCLGILNKESLKTREMQETPLFQLFQTGETSKFDQRVRHQSIKSISVNSIF